MCVGTACESVEMAGVGWCGARRISHDAVRSYPCIYNIRSPKFKVALVKENVQVESYCGDLAPS